MRLAVASASLEGFSEVFASPEGDGLSLAFFSLRAAFLEAGSGKLTSISISSGRASRLRFFAGVSAVSSFASSVAVGLETSDFDLLDLDRSFLSFFSFFSRRSVLVTSTSISSGLSSFVCFDIAVVLARSVVQSLELFHAAPIFVSSTGKSGTGDVSTRLLSCAYRRPDVNVRITNRSEVASFGIASWIG